MKVATVGLTGRPNGLSTGLEASGLAAFKKSGSLGGEPGAPEGGGLPPAGGGLPLAGGGDVGPADEPPAVEALLGDVGLVCFGVVGLDCLGVVGLDCLGVVGLVGLGVVPPVVCLAVVPPVLLPVVKAKAKKASKDTRLLKERGETLITAGELSFTTLTGPQEELGVFEG
uniref:Uncharacterized protein n=1 Tax=Romanomermis culicivorax TaxID=13658 RepID=A0A915HPR2_ROMCU